MDHNDFYPNLEEHAAYLRIHPGPGEQALINALISQSIPFQFQHVYEKEIVPFLISDKNLAVIIEDETHDHSDGYYRQVKRVENLKNLGLSVLTFPGFEAEHSIDKILEQIKSHIDE